ncbi:hypothetical protein FCM35_KLT06008 [Carex littledalei]|uniref:CCHC-type domain-containing protein n=1 Tax=Carex littledalei TaxID=544730 RepID=A0A833QM03_9POAL|nr:hypothetical protein FCM35_KLT06008 [Carex littledalei]
MNDPLERTERQAATRLEALKAIRTTTQAAILRRKTEIASFRRHSYAQVLKAAIKREQARQQVYTAQQTPTVRYNSNGNKKTTERHHNTTASQNSEEGWTVVTRKKHNRQARPQTLKSLAKCKQDLMTQGRCFKCLQKGHRRFQCRGQLKCLKCGHKGHTAGRCIHPRVQNVSPAKATMGQKQTEATRGVNATEPTTMPQPAVIAQPTPT